MPNAAANPVGVTALQAVIAALRQENEYLRWQLAKARHARFGRRSERGDLLEQRPLYPAGAAALEAAPAIYSLLGTAALSGVEPMAYLREVLARIAGHPVNRIQELLPWNLVLPGNEAEQAA